MILDLFFQCYRSEIEAAYGVQNINLILHAYVKKYTVKEYYMNMIYLPF